MNKLIVLVLALAIAAPALADDLVEAPFRGEPGSTYSQWTYDDPCGVYDWDPPDVYSFVGGLTNLDGSPAGDPTFPYDPCEPFFSAQVWGSDGDPCAPDWAGALPGGRFGGVTYAYGSWDIGNFIDDLPAKDLWVQITYFGGPIEDLDFGPGAGSWIEDPCAVEEPWGWAYDEFDEYEAPISEWESGWPDPLETWMGGGGYEIWTDAELVDRLALADGWTHDVWSMTMETNPDFEWFEFGWWEGQQILIDQIIIETISYVPEPATMVLLGLGSLMMIRRKKK